MSATISARARSPCRSCSPSGAAPTRSAPSGSARWSRARSATATSRQAVAIMQPPPRPRGHGRARPPLRRHGPRRAGAVPRRPDEAGAARGRRFLHRPGALSAPRIERRPAQRSSVGTTHQPGCAAPDRAGGRWPRDASPKSPNTVAPEPDMRARRQPASARSAPSASPITGATVEGRRFEIVAGRARSPRAAPPVAAVRDLRMGGAARGSRRRSRPSALNTGAVGTGTPGIDQHRRRAAAGQGRAELSPAPRIIRARGSRQTGTSAPVARAAAIRSGSSSGESVEARDEAQRRGGVRRAAADAGRHRQALRQMEGPARRPGDRRGERRAAPCSTRLSRSGRPAARSGRSPCRPRCRPGSAPGCRRCPRRPRGSPAHDSRRRPTPEDVERQVDLGGRAGDEAGLGASSAAPLPAGRPLALKPGRPSTVRSLLAAPRGGWRVPHAEPVCASARRL